MEDLTGLGKLADSQLLNKSYDDLLAGAAKESGTALTDTVRAFRLFTAPIQLLAVAQARLEAFCQRVRNQVPDDRQQEAVPSIALPILFAVRDIEDYNPLIFLYENLLARAIDKDRSSEAHPAFVHIIEQLAPDEAIIINAFRDQDEYPYPNCRQNDYLWPDHPFDEIIHPKNFEVYLEHLKSLTLINTPIARPVEHTLAFVAPSPPTPSKIAISKFGKLFLEACTTVNNT